MTESRQRTRPPSDWQRTEDGWHDRQVPKLSEDTNRSFDQQQWSDLSENSSSVVAGLLQLEDTTAHQEISEVPYQFHLP